MGRKKGWFLTSDAPAREPSRLTSSLISSFRMSDLHRLRWNQPRLPKHEYPRPNLLADLCHVRMVRERHFISEDVRKSGVSILALEWGRSEKHFINQDAQSPPVHGAGVSIAFDHFWGYVFLRADKGIRSEVGNAGLRVDQRIACRV